MPVSAQQINTPLDKHQRGNTSTRSAKSGAEEQFIAAGLRGQGSHKQGMCLFTGIGMYEYVG